MQEYEITYLLDPSLEEGARVELDAAIDRLVEEAKGVISFSSPSTRRRLAYPIGKQHVCFARTVQATVAPEELGSIQDGLRKHKGVLRFTVLNTPRRQEVTPEIFEAATKRQQVQPQPKAATAPGKEISMAEVEEKIEQALDEEVK